MMLYLAYFILLFAVIQMVVVLINLLFYCGLRENYTVDISESSDLVSVLIPARNEEKNIANLLTDLQRQNYQNIEIIVFDDLSTDNTANVVRTFQQHDARVRLIASEGLPINWLGKNFGCYSMSKVAKGRFLLFLDADVLVYNNFIVNAIAQLKDYNVGLLSVFPKQTMVSWGERITVPNMNYILLSLLPLILVRKSKRSSLSAANGQCMLFDALIYHQLEPHHVFKSNRVEDIEIARYYKRNGVGVSCLLGNETITCRMYEGFNDAVRGFSKNVISFFGNSVVLAILYWCITALGTVLVFLMLPSFLIISYLLVVLVTRVLVSVLSRQSVFQNLLLIIPQKISLAVFIYRNIINSFTKQHHWKDRAV